jgi:hypothetical protein
MGQVNIDVRSFIIRPRNFYSIEGNFASVISDFVVIIFATYCRHALIDKHQMGVRFSL